MSVVYKDFGWRSRAAANGEVGVRLASKLIAKVNGQSNIRTVCDLGCGNGYLAGQLANQGYEVVGVDASETGIRLAREHYPASRFICAQIGPGGVYRSEAGKFDMVISSEVIEHLYRPSDLVESAAELLKSRGHLLISTPYHGYLKNVALSVCSKWDTHLSPLENGGHIKFFSVRTLSTLLTSHGFTDLKFDYFGRAPWFWMSMICSARKCN
jgi:SAM-dependent methyltransferase